MAKRIEELMKLKEAADDRKAQRDALVEKGTESVRRAVVLPILEEIEASDDPKAAIAAIRKRLSL